MSEPQETRPVEAESIKVIFEIALREYIDENDRAKQFDGKTAPMIAATGAVLVFVAGVISKPPATLPPFWQGVYFSIVCLSLFALATAQFFFLAVLWGRQFMRIALRDIVDHEWMSTNPGELRTALAEKYRDLLSNNTPVTERKARLHKWGIVFLNVGLAILVALLVIAGMTVRLQL